MPTAIQINVQGVTAEQSQRQFRTFVADRYPQWIADACRTRPIIRLNLKPSELVDSSGGRSSSRSRPSRIASTPRVDRGAGAAVRPCRRRVRDSGAVAGHRRSGAREGIIGQAAQLSDRRSERRTIPEQEAALAQKGGMLPLNTKLVNVAARRRRRPMVPGIAIPVITGQDCATRAPARMKCGKWEAGFTLSQDGGKRFEAFTGANIGNRWRWCSTIRSAQRGDHQCAISDSGRITGLGQRAGSVGSRAGHAVGFAAGGHRVPGRAHRRTFAGRGFDPPGHISPGIAGLVAVILVMLVYYK